MFILNCNNSAMSDATDVAFTVPGIDIFYVARYQIITLFFIISLTRIAAINIDQAVYLLDALIRITDILSFSPLSLTSLTRCSQIVCSS